MVKAIVHSLKAAIAPLAAAMIALVLVVAAGPATAGAGTLQGPGTGALSKGAAASPNADLKGHPMTLFNNKGVFTITSDTSDACAPATCDVAACECQQYDATGVRQSAFGAGNLEIQFNETLNSIDVVSAGVTGSNCRPFFGVGSIAGPAGKNTADFFASGNSCGSGSLFADDSTFYIIPGSGTGNLANARGTGTFNFTKDFDTLEAVFFMEGDLQRNP